MNFIGIDFGTHNCTISKVFDYDEAKVLYSNTWKSEVVIVQ